MKLNEKSLINFREILSRELMKVNDGEKIQLEKDLLEDLLFQKRYDEKTKKHYKVLIWSGLFLQNVDLSMVSFDSVDWSDSKEKYLENTNARIDFSNGYYSSIQKHQGAKIIQNCRFDGTDLSGSKIDYIDEINNTSLKNTNIDLSQYFEDKKKMSYVELNDNNLSKSTIDLVEYPDVSFTNTGAKLQFDPNDQRIKFKHSKTYYGRNYSKDFYAGCYINGVRVYTKEKRINMAKIRYSGYEAFERSTINSTLGLIKKHKKGL